MGRAPAGNTETSDLGKAVFGGETAERRTARWAGAIFLGEGSDGYTSSCLRNQRSDVWGSTSSPVTWEEMPGGVTMLAAGQGGWQRGEAVTNSLGCLVLAPRVAGRLGILWLCSPRGW